MNKKFLVAIISCILLNTLSCSAPAPKIVPEYKGVDPRMQPLVNEYLVLAKLDQISFRHVVTVGFKRINQGDVIGICNYAPTFREIDVDIDFWNNSSNLSHLSLLFHELSHCYCTRDHDYGEDKKYPETQTARIARAIKWKLEGGPKPGYWDDGCPVSLMYPVLVDDECVRSHYNEYIQEMFDRCEPW